MQRPSGVKLWQPARGNRIAQRSGRCPSIRARRGAGGIVLCRICKYRELFGKVHAASKYRIFVRVFMLCEHLYVVNGGSGCVRIGYE